MSETATIATSSSESSNDRRQALDLSHPTLPFTRSTTIRLTGAAAAAAAIPTESFTMSGKFIYATTTTSASSSAPAATAAYHLSTRNTRTGKPWQLQISHLLPSETRRLSLAAAENTSTPSHAPPPTLIKYDDDLTLYTGERLSVPLSIGQKPLLCLRGRRRGTLPGTVVVEKTLGHRSRGHKFWHMTPIRRPLTQAESDRMQALMHRRGYRTSDDWRKELLFTVRVKGGSGGMEWTDERGEEVAMETETETGGGAQKQLVLMGSVEPERRDLMVACWASRNFVQSVAAEDEGDGSRE